MVCVCVFVFFTHKGEKKNTPRMNVFFARFCFANCVTIFFSAFRRTKNQSHKNARFKRAHKTKKTRGCDNFIFLFFFIFSARGTRQKMENVFFPRKPTKISHFMFADLVWFFFPLLGRKEKNARVFGAIFFATAFFRKTHEKSAKKTTVCVSQTGVANFFRFRQDKKHERQNCIF